MVNIALDPGVYGRLVLFHRVLDSAPGRAMDAFLTAVRTKDAIEERYLALVRSLYEEEPARVLLPDAWQNHLISRILMDENPLTREISGELNPEALGAASHDLGLLQRLFPLSASVCRNAAELAPLPSWPVRKLGETVDPADQGLRAAALELAQAVDWSRLAEWLHGRFQELGTGIVGSYWYLRWEEGALQGIQRPSVFDLDDLVGLEEAKATVLRNTEQLVSGRPANNLLLYGQRGTGKSSMVRGLIPRFGAPGLRLVEVPRAAVSQLPLIFRLLSRYPQTFILFLDDLSFDEAEASYKAFKSEMEGALERRPENVALYATSNRRHLVPERWSDRHSPETAEVHGQDALEEKLSLADRFGVTVLFTTPSQDEFLRIVEHMAAQRSLQIDRDHLREAALRWVMWNNPRSGRSARQFLDDLEGRLK